MKAFLLAAGMGTRLRPLTDVTPKCLVRIGGKPLLLIWFELLLRHGVDSVLVNAHYLSDQVARFVRDNCPEGLDVVVSHEQELLGSAGTVAANRKFVQGEKDVLVVYADNLTDIDISELCRFHRSKSGVLTMGTFETDQPSECGIVVCDEEDRVLEFQEKPVEPKSRLASAGIYVMSPVVVDVIPAKRPCDFGFDVFPLLLGRMYAYRIRELFVDVGTLPRLNAARQAWARRCGGSCDLPHSQGKSGLCDDRDSEKC
jgi:mannose-1-phosphate guanylyltransferase